MRIILWHNQIIVGLLRTGAIRPEFQIDLMLAQLDGILKNIFPPHSQLIIRNYPALGKHIKIYIYDES